MDLAVKQQLKLKIKEELRSYSIAAPNVFSDYTIDTFIKVLLHPLNDFSLKLDGIQTRIPNALSKILLQDLPKNEVLASFPDFAKVEPFLRKMLFLVNPSQFQVYQIQDNPKRGLAAYIDALGLNPNRIRYDLDTVDNLQNLPNYAVHFFRAYNLRNVESHQCETWPKKELYENIESLLVVYIYSTYKHIKALKSIVSQEPDMSNYLSNVVSNFEIWQKRFVHITGKETFEEIDLYAIESDEYKGNKDERLREGKIDSLRDGIEENRMVVLGDPGMGKSTTLQYMAYKDAQILLATMNHPTVKIPVYIELKLFSNTDTVIDVAARKLNIDRDKLIEYLFDGKITLFLDGLNEILKDLKQSIRIDIQNIINIYPRTLAIVTTRPLAYSNEFQNTPVFILQRLENIQVEEFLEKNCNHETTKSIIINELKSNQRLGKIIRVPLLLKMLINVIITNKGVIPSNKALVIKKFITGVYEREKRKLTSDIDLRVIHRLLCFLGYKTRELKGSNAGCQIDEFEAIIEKRIEESRFTISVYDFLDFAVDLNLIVKDQDKYSFIHELYQEYYASEEFYRIMAKQK